MTLTKWPHKAPVIHTGLGRIHRQGKIWYNSRRSPLSVATQFLFRPRPWVRAIGDCVMRNAGLKPSRFVSIHIRHSVEKLAEGKKLGATLPVLQAYHPLAVALAEDVGTRKIFLQTASPVALADFAAFALTQSLNVFYTDNPRSEHDSWGGWLAGSEMLQAAVGAVNAYISSHAAITASPGISQWTDFLRRSTPPTTGTNQAFLSVRCRPSMKRDSWYEVFGPRASMSMLALGRACTVAGGTHVHSAPAKDDQN